MKGWFAGYMVEQISFVFSNTCVYLLDCIIKTDHIMNIVNDRLYKITVYKGKKET